MKTEPISLEHQRLISPAWKRLCQDYNLHFSEYSFANIYLFRKKHDYQFVECDQIPCVRGKFKTEAYYVIPSVPPNRLKLTSLCGNEGKDYCIFPIPDIWLEEYRKMEMTLTTCRADTDYLFHISKLQSLAGRELSSRRNLLHQLERKFKLETREITESEVELVLDLIEKWQMQMNKAREKTDYFSCREAVEYRDRLELFGRIAFANGEPFGFTLGELLSPKTALLHFAKSLHHFKGATPFLYQDFANHLPSSVEWINLEQDLGISSLRQAKKAYDPDLLLTKWKAC